MLSSETDVLIVGAGPTGLALAAALQKAGVDHILIDALEQGQNTSRAAVVHAHTLEMLQSIGVSEALYAHGIRLTRFTVRDRDQPLLSLQFDKLPSQFQYLLMVPQSMTEAVLAGALVESGGEIHRGATAVSAELGGAGAVIRINTVEGEQIVQARFVVGADGMHSAVRDAAEIPFEGEAESVSFVLADVRMEWPLKPDEVSLFFSPAGLVVVAPLPGDRFRIVATLDNAPQNPAVADIERLLNARGPLAGCRVEEVIWGSRFRVQHRLARNYRKGPFVLMGDAAHVHSPAGGQGMNTGIVDAIVLANALRAIILEKVDDKLLDEYAEVRREAAAEVLALASRITRLATVQSGPVRIARNFMLRILNRLPRFKSALALSLSGLSRRKQSILPGLHPFAPSAPSKAGAIRQTASTSA